MTPDYFVRIDHWRAYAHEGAPGDAGFWVVVCAGVRGFLEAYTSRCVVDDFGNLVRVPE